MSRTVLELLAKLRCQRLVTPL